MAVRIEGLATGTPAAVRVSGVFAFVRTLTKSEVLTGLEPGSYTIQALEVTVQGQNWTGAPGEQTVTVVPELETAVSVRYREALVETGGLVVNVTGLPAGVPAAITVTGPDDVERRLAGTTTYDSLRPGLYWLDASSVTDGDSTFVPNPPGDGVEVVAGEVSSVTIAYWVVRHGPDNFRIDGMHFTQAVQRYDGSVPLVAGRAALARIFVLSNGGPVPLHPKVRLRLYSFGVLVATYLIPSPATGAPFVVSEGRLEGSWNQIIPADLMQPGLSANADADPEGEFAESHKDDNNFPALGPPLPLDVRQTPALEVRFVPIRQSANSLTGVVTEENKVSFVGTARGLLPIAAYDAEVRAPYTTTAPALEKENGNGAWGQILSELLALRTAEGGSRYYYGVVKVNYTGGIGGLGYLGGTARTAIGWDQPPTRSGIMAHELGHNMGRKHAPCGAPDSVDPDYPYPGGRIGLWGMHPENPRPRDPGDTYDLMGYCSPQWISDYTWRGILEFRGAEPGRALGATSAVILERGLLLWGRITPEGPVLEPAFEVTAPSSAPAPGPHRIEGLDAAGRSLFTVDFAAAEVHDLPTGPEGAFAFVLPATQARLDELTELRLYAGGRSAVRRSPPSGPPGSKLSREGTLVWDASGHPMALIRDAASGEILTFARGGEVRLGPGARKVDATFSNGARSQTVRLQRDPDR